MKTAERDLFAIGDLLVLHLYRIILLYSGQTLRAAEQVFRAVVDWGVFGLGAVSNAVDEMLQRRRRLSLELQLFPFLHRLLLGDRTEQVRWCADAWSGRRDLTARRTGSAGAAAGLGTHRPLAYKRTRDSFIHYYRALARRLMFSSALVR